jgi:glycerophosphoryl diester phosphodiesterase
VAVARPDPLRRPLVIAHRGASGLRPEHSLAAYELAIEHGADAIEPDVVVSRDGVLVLRHENELSGTTDVAERSDLADRRRTRTVDGEVRTGWFAEDLDAHEIESLRCVERLPALRPESARHDGEQRVLRLDRLLDLLDAAPRPVVLVAELKHTAHLDRAGAGLPERFADAVRAFAERHPVVVESFEQGALDRVRAAGLRARTVFLADRIGAPADLVARDGAAARSYADHLTDAGLDRLAAEGVDGVSVDTSLVVGPDGRPTDLTHRAHAAGLDVFVWTLRPENAFLQPAFADPGLAPGALGRWRDEAEAVLDAGVDGVFADRPDLIRPVVDARSPTAGRQ